MIYEDVKTSIDITSSFIFLTICFDFVLDRNSQQRSLQIDTDTLEDTPLVMNPQDDLSKSARKIHAHFEEHDDMLRETSIAEKYWKQIVIDIKEKEEKMAEEHTNGNHSLS